MRVQWAMLARYAEVQNGLFTLVGAGLDSLMVARMPAVIQTFFAVMFRYPESEAGTTPLFEFVVLDENLQGVGHPVAFQARELALNPNHPPGWEAGLPLAGPFALEVTTSGTYSLSIRADGGLVGDVPFRVQVP